MKTDPLYRCGYLFLFVLAALFSAGNARATITVTNYWRMGEDDPGAVSGGHFTNTVDGVRGWVITNTPAGGVYPYYTNNVAAAAAAEAVSDLSAGYPANQYGTGSVIPGLTDNFGIECWVNLATNSSGAVVVYNGNTGSSGWGLFQSGTNILGFFGGVGFFGSAPAPTNAWTHVALVRDDGTNTLYLNGAPAGTSTLAPASPAGNFLVAANNSHTQNFSGLVDEIRVFTFAAGQFSTNDLLLYASTVVANTNDSGAGSLRQVLAQAGNDYRVNFHTNLSGQTITLASTLQISGSLTIDASALPGGIQISGDYRVQVFNILYPDVVSLNSLNIIDGQVNGEGGGIYNDGTLMLNDCTLTGDVAVGEGFGGGIYNAQSMTVNECTLSGNSSAGAGGCIYDAGGIAILNDCTIVINASEGAGNGGGIFVLGDLSFVLNNSIVAANLPSDIENYGGIVSLGGENLIGIFDGAVPSGAKYVTNTAPNLAPLGYYGGPTQTMPPLPGSPAIGASSGAGFDTDQRGYPRPQIGKSDIGAVELPIVQFTASPTNDWQPTPVQFNGPLVDSDGTAITQWHWSFGDNATNTAQNPVHAYGQTGEFSPALTVTNTLGLILAASGPAINVSPPLSLTGISRSGTNLMLEGANGFSGQAYVVLAATNLALPLNQWTPLATNAWSASGNFSLIVTNTVHPSVPDLFFQLQAR